MDDPTDISNDPPRGKASTQREFPERPRSRTIARISIGIS